MSIRTTKVSTAFYDVLSVYDLDGSKLTGLSSSDFSVSFYKDGAAQSALSYTLSEISSTGEYALAIADGFPSNGFWVVSAECEDADATFRTDVEVRTADIDTVYSIVYGGFGSEQVNISLTDSAHDDAPVVGAKINVWNAAGTAFVTFGTSGADGLTSLLLDPGSYLVKTFKAGLSAGSKTVTVEDTDSLQTFGISVESVEITAPSSPNMCRIYADFIDQTGDAVENFEVSVTNLFDPSASSGLAVVESSASYSTNAVGHIEFDVVIGTRVKVSLITTGLTRDFTVPNQPTSNLLTLLGSATDPFKVVEDSTNPFVVVSVG